jgi:hypothetical protein
MKAGTFEVFTGPILDNTGKERLAKGTAADDEFVRRSLHRARPLQIKLLNRILGDERAER